MKKANMILALLLAMSLLAGCSTENSGSSTAVVNTSAGADTSENAAKADTTEITFTDDGIAASAANGVEIDGTTLKITAAGTYVLSGSCTNGSVKVQKGLTNVCLVLNGLTLTSANTAPIICGKSTEVTIQIAAGTENTLADTAENNEESGNADAENAVIKCKDGSKVLLCGAGTLNIQANGKNGIKSGASTAEEGDAWLHIQELTLNIDAPVNDAVNAEAELNVESGTITISAGDDALHSDYTLNIGAEGTDGPGITITECQEGLEGAIVNVYSGDINILAVDDCVNAANSDLTGYDFELNIFGGTVNAYSSTGDGFDSNGNMTISGGTVAVWTANTADNEPLDADGTVTISGGTVLAAGSSGMGMNLAATQPCVTFSGSETMEMPEQGEQPLQSEQSGMDARQNGEKGFPGSQNTLLTDGSTFTIADSDGTVLYTADASANASFVLFSSADIAADEELTLSAENNQTTGTAQTGTVSTGRGGMGGHGGQRPDGEQADGKAPSDKFGGQPADGDAPPEKPGNDLPQNGNDTEKAAEKA